MSHPKITEQEILLSYLLPPAPLPTILPYQKFLLLVPATYRNNPEYSPTLKALYRQLQSQRSTVIDQVRLNIDRECGPGSSKAATLRARLAKQIMIEEGENEDEDDDEPRKRRKLDDGGDDEEGTEDEYDEFTDPVLLAAQRAVFEDENELHPAARILPEMERGGNARDFHTRESLLREMDRVRRSLDVEVDELEEECRRIREGIGETVSGLSDLRYGKRLSTGEEGQGQFDDVVEAIEDFGRVVRSKMKN